MLDRYYNQFLDYGRPIPLNFARRKTIGGFNGAGGLFSPFHSSADRPAERIRNFPESSYNPVC